tara:strand:- start:4712 stop:4861 length:150 start_codon:yes stop_codon:yes gene_type:complete
MVEIWIAHKLRILRISKKLGFDFKKSTPFALVNAFNRSGDCKIKKAAEN